MFFLPKIEKVNNNVQKICYEIAICKIELYVQVWPQNSKYIYDMADNPHGENQTAFFLNKK